MKIEINSLLIGWILGIITTLTWCLSASLRAGLFE